MLILPCESRTTVAWSISSSNITSWYFFFYFLFFYYYYQQSLPYEYKSVTVVRLGSHRWGKWLNLVFSWELHISFHTCSANDKRTTIVRCSYDSLLKSRALFDGRNAILRMSYGFLAICKTAFELTCTITLQLSCAFYDVCDFISKIWLRDRTYIRQKYTDWKVHIPLQLHVLCFNHFPGTNQSCLIHPKYMRLYLVKICGRESFEHSVQ